MNQRNHGVTQDRSCLPPPYYPTIECFKEYFLISLGTSAIWVFFNSCHESPNQIFCHHTQKNSKQQQKDLNKNAKFFKFHPFPISISQKLVDYMAMIFTQVFIQSEIKLNISLRENLRNNLILI